MHGIGDEAQTSGAELFPIDQLLDGIEIWRDGVEGMNQVVARRQRRDALRENGAELLARPAATVDGSAELP